MTATCTFDVFSSPDGFGAASGNWTGCWGKQCPGLQGTLDGSIEELSYRPTLHV